MHKKITTNQAITAVVYSSNVFKKVREAYLKEDYNQATKKPEQKK